MSNNYIITGGPGTGKTSILNALRSKGITCFEETARQVIMEELEKGSDKLPYKDVEAFTKIVIARGQKLLQQANPEEINIFDRGLPDSDAYLSVDNIETPDYLKSAIEGANYNKKVFYTPIWKEIYQNDKERLESLDHAVKIHEALLATYAKYGYEMIEIPIGDVESRAAFVLSKLNVTTPA